MNNPHLYFSAFVRIHSPRGQTIRGLSFHSLRGFAGMPHSQPSRLGTLLLLLAAAIGFALALYAWLTPLTGVTGTIGALGVAIASVMLAVLTLILRASSGRGARIFWGIVTLFVLVGIGFAALLLHQGVITAAMLLGLIGLILIGRRPARHPQHARA